MTETEAVMALRLRRMQWLATGLVAAMAVLFVATSLLRERYRGIDVVRAFAEAALIGGLADWFAVTALFRHPLGLPIPHTAIVPRRKDEIGRALARFIADNFLVRDVVEAQLANVDLSARLGAWIERPHNAASLSRDIGVAIEWLLRSADGGALRESAKSSLRKLADSVPAHAAFATLVDVLVSGNHAQALIDQLVVYARDQLDRNKLNIRLRIRERSPWWLPRFVDEEIYDQLVGELERVLDEIGDDPSHEARIQLNDRLRALKYALGHDENLIAKGETLRSELLDHPDVRDFVAELWNRARDLLEGELANPDSDIRRGLERELRTVGQRLSTEPEIGARLDVWLREAIVYVVEHYREPISRIVSETIAQWDAPAASRRIELHIGRDLQFIRVNGTLVGGLVGVLLYLVWAALVS